MRIIINKKLNKGFTLIELLVATVIVGTVSIVAVNLLYSTVLNRSRQDSIQAGSEDVRNFTSLVSESIKAANNVEFTGTSQIKTTKFTDSGTICKTFRLNGKSLEMAEDDSGSCNPTSFSKITETGTVIDSVASKFEQISSSPKTVSIKISGTSKDSFGEHNFSYETTVVSRISG